MKNRATERRVYRNANEAVSQAFNLASGEIRSVPVQYRYMSRNLGTSRGT